MPRTVVWTFACVDEVDAEESMDYLSDNSTESDGSDA